MPMVAADRRIVRVAFVASGMVFAGLMWMLYLRGEPTMVPEWTAWLPTVNAGLNAVTLVLVTLGVIAIRSGRRKVHIALLSGALVAEAAFLLTYATYHFYQGDTPYPGTGILRPIYFAVLISHIVSSAVALPLVVTSAALAISRRFKTHAGWARVAAPVWIYVSITGLVVYAMLHG